MCPERQGDSLRHPQAGGCRSGDHKATESGFSARTSHCPGIKIESGLYTCPVKFLNFSFLLLLLPSHIYSPYSRFPSSKVGSRDDSNVYIRMKTKAAQEVGVAVNHVKLPQDSTESQIVDTIHSLNRWVFQKGCLFPSLGLGATVAGVCVLLWHVHLELCAQVTLASPSVQGPCCSCHLASAATGHTRASQR